MQLRRLHLEELRVTAGLALVALDAKAGKHRIAAGLR
jgi:hypothetical protein